MRNEYSIGLPIVLNILKNYRYQGKYMNFKKFIIQRLGTENLCGIYAFQNKNDGKVYIGSSKKLADRIRSHINMLKSGTHHSPHFQYAWNNYGPEMFNLIILEIVNEPDSLVTREQYWINLYQSYNCKYGYNIAPTAGNTLGVKMSEQAKQKMSNVRKGRKFSEEHKQKISIALKGRQFKQESIEKMRKSLTGRKLSIEHVEKMKKNMLGKNTGKRSSDICKKISEACKGRTPHNRKLTENDVREIRRLLSEGKRQQDIANQFGVAKSLIYYIHHNLAWKNVI
jgi:group I intron endonuclease